MSVQHQSLGLDAETSRFAQRCLVIGQHGTTFVGDIVHFHGTTLQVVSCCSYEAYETQTFCEILREDVDTTAQFD